MNESTKDVVMALMVLPHKADTNPNDWKRVSPKLLPIALDVARACKRRGIPILFTSIIREAIEGVSVSATHAEGRAFDLSVKGWSTDDLDDVLMEVNRKHAQKRGAVSAADGVPRALVYEHRAAEGPETNLEAYEKVNSASPHLHGQCRP